MRLLTLFIFAVIHSIALGHICLTPWSSYSYFYLNDGRSEGSGATHGSNTLFGFNATFCPKFYASVFGNYQNSSNKNSSPPASLDFGVPSFGNEGLAKVNGWGVGGSGNYLICPNYWGIQSWIYASFLYLWQTQHTTVSTATPSNTGELPPDILNNTSGTNWQISGGANFIKPCRRFTLMTNLNYLYVSSATQGYSSTIITPDFLPFDENITGSGSAFGIGNASAILTFLPQFMMNPYVGGGISYDLNRSASFPTQSSENGTTQSSVPYRPRFEWNLGAGLIITKAALGLNISYLHRQRVGPILSDIFTLYGSYAF